MNNNVTDDEKDDPPGRLYERMGRYGNAELSWIFEKDIEGGWPSWVPITVESLSIPLSRF